jgi:tetratricopeptide (TPR) repeat protein
LPEFCLDYLNSKTFAMFCDCCCPKKQSKEILKEHLLNPSSDLPPNSNSNPPFPHIGVSLQVLQHILDTAQRKHRKAIRFSSADICKKIIVPATTRYDCSYVEFLRATNHPLVSTTSGNHSNEHLISPLPTLLHSSMPTSSESAFVPVHNAVPQPSTTKPNPNEATCEDSSQGFMLANRNSQTKRPILSSSRADPIAAALGPPTHFVSHAWTNCFAELIEVLRAFEHQQQGALTTKGTKESDNDANKKISLRPFYYWLDIVVLPQQRTNRRSVTCWSSTFREGIRSIGQTIVVFSPWRTPVYLTRAWCLWELYNAIVAETEIQILIPDCQRQSLVSTLSIEMESMIERLSSIDISLAKVHDRTSFLSDIREIVEVSDINLKVSNHLRTWFAETARLAVMSVNDSATRNISQADHLTRVAKLLSEQGNVNGAKVLYEQALQIREHMLGPEHPSNATAVNNLVSSLETLGEYEAARPLLMRSLTLCENRCGPMHLDTAICVEKLAALLQDMCEFAEAKSFYTRALKIREKAQGAKHLDVSKVVTGLALINNLLDDKTAARELYQRALDIREYQLEPDHPEVAVSLRNLASLLQDQQEFTAAQPLYERALYIWIKTLGPDHPDVASLLNNLGNLNQSIGNYEKAIQLHSHALLIREHSLGAEHPSVAESLSNIAALLETHGGADEAKQLYLQALEILEHSFGALDERTVLTRAKLAALNQSIFPLL